MLKVLSEGEMNLIDIKYRVLEKVNVSFDTCPVSGHNYHGLVERKLKTVQDALARHEFANARLTASGLQSLLKFIESVMNSTPMGYSYDRSSSNTPLLRMISPTMLRIGRISLRTLQGPVRVPSSPKSMIQRVNDLHEIWYQIYNDTYILKTIVDMVPKWFKHNRDLNFGDVVFLRKEDGVFGGRWTIGEVDTVLKSKDGLVRRAKVHYVNAF